MRIITHINNVKCIEWGLTANQGALFDLINQLQSWAEVVCVGGDVYYWASKNMICEELPLFFTKPDAVYRNLKILQEKCLINYIKIGAKDCISLTQKGKEWNSGLNPNDVSKPELARVQTRKGSVLNPTYNITKDNIINDNKDTTTPPVKTENPPKAEKEPKAEKFNPKKALQNLGIADDLIDDWLAIRKTKKMPLTQRALNLTIAEAEKAGLTLTEAIDCCAARVWGGFMAEYLENKQSNIYAKKDIREIPKVYKKNDGTLMRNALDQPINTTDLPF